MGNDIDTPLNIFKEEKDLLNLYGLKDVQTLFDKADLENFAEMLFNALTKFKDIKEAKWAIRFISLNASEVLEEQIYNFVSELYREGRFKEGKYFIECLIYSKRQKVVNLLSKLGEEQNAKFVEDKDYFVNLLPYSYILGLDDEIIRLLKEYDMKKPSWYDTNGDFTIQKFVNSVGRLKQTLKTKNEDL